MTRLLLVCRANIARSPAAEFLARQQLGPDTDWSVVSRGTHALAGAGIAHEIGDALARRGISADSHRAEQATARDIRSADMVLTFESAQRAWVLAAEPSAVRYTFTIRRAARVLEGAKPDTVDHGLAAYTAADDFEDPYGRGAAVAESAVENIATLLGTILPALQSGESGVLGLTTRPPRQRARHRMEA